MRVELPDNLSCSQCILQVMMMMMMMMMVMVMQTTYTAGNNWGSGPQSAEVASQDCVEGGAKLGCGPQETFRGCADICVGELCPHQDQVGSAGSYDDDCADIMSPGNMP